MEKKTLYAVQIPPEDVFSPLQQDLQHSLWNGKKLDGSGLEGLIFYSKDSLIKNPMYHAYGHYEYFDIFEKCYHDGLLDVFTSGHKISVNDFMALDTKFNIRVSRDITAWRNALKTYLYDMKVTCRPYVSMSTNCLILSAVTGLTYSMKMMESPSDNMYEYLYYPKAKFSDVDIENFKSQYFNTGSMWALCDKEPSRKELEEGSFSSLGIFVYTEKDSSDNEIREKVRQLDGYENIEIVLYRFSYSVKTNIYNKENET